MLSKKILPQRVDVINSLRVLTNAYGLDFSLFWVYLQMHFVSRVLKLSFKCI
jgi:hypothetical protein